jgi:translation initiation factor 1A
LYTTFIYIVHLTYYDLFNLFWIDILVKGGEYLSKGRGGQQNQEIRRVRSPKRGEIPGVVEQILGHGKLKVRCADGKIRLSRIPGKMKKRIWIREGDVVLIKPWDFQSDEKADVIWRYTRTEANWLERRGYLNI